nr:hypothetical protein [Tanacetum cinerariifolium]
SVREKLDEGLSRFPDCKKLNMFREKFKETTTAGVCSDIEEDEVKSSKVEDLENEKQQISNKDDRVVDDFVTTIQDSVTEGKGVKFIENDNVLVDDGNVGAEDVVDYQDTIEDIFKQDEQIQSAEDDKKLAVFIQKMKDSFNEDEKLMSLQNFEM